MFNKLILVAVLSLCSAVSFSSETVDSDYLENSIHDDYVELSNEIFLKGCTWPDGDLLLGIGQLGVAAIHSPIDTAYLAHREAMGKSMRYGSLLSRETFNEIATKARKKFPKKRSLMCDRVINWTFNFETAINKIDALMDEHANSKMNTSESSINASYDGNAKIEGIIDSCANKSLSYMKDYESQLEHIKNTAKRRGQRLYTYEYDFAWDQKTLVKAKDIQSCADVKQAFNEYTDRIMIMNKKIGRILILRNLIDFSAKGLF